jgi:hypothetical protein
MPQRILTSNAGDLNSAALPNDTSVQAGGAGAAGVARASGNLWMQAPAGGTPPASTGSDIVVATATIPAGALDAAGRTIEIWAAGSFAANGNTKTVKMIVAPTTATIGSAVVGGTTISTSGAVTTNGQGWSMEAQITKTGANGSNTQTAVHFATQVGAVSAALTNPQSLTLTESSAITVALTINCATTASDAALWNFQGFWAN